MNIRRLSIVLALGVSVSCTQTPSPKTLAGEWHQDIDYLQTKGPVNQFLEAVEFEDVELFISDGQLAATRIIGTEPDRKRIYWKSPLSFTTDSAGTHKITFNSHEGQPITATVSFEGKHLILKIGKSRMAFLKERATNLRIKGYVPKS